MEVPHPRCAGLDVHKKTVVAAVRLATPHQVMRAIRTFGTTTAELLKLSAWLATRPMSPTLNGWPSCWPTA